MDETFEIKAEFFFFGFLCFPGASFLLKEVAPNACFPHWEKGHERARRGTNMILCKFNWDPGLCPFGAGGKLSLVSLRGSAALGGGIVVMILEHLVLPWLHREGRIYLSVGQGQRTLGSAASIPRQ